MKFWSSFFLLVVALFGRTSAFAQQPTPTRPPSSITTLADAGFRVSATPRPGGGTTGAYGANRRVWAPTDKAYRGIAGTFTLPDINLGDKYSPSEYDDANNVNVGTNPDLNKPTFYFGGQGSRFNFESGFQYEGNYKDNLPAGWSTYSNISLSYAVEGKAGLETSGNWYQSVDASNRQPNSPGKTVRASISLLSNGEIFSYIQSDLPFPVPMKVVDKVVYKPNTYPIVTSADGKVQENGVKFRRVIGMTQKTGLYGEGSNAWVRNAGFDAGTLSVWGSNTNVTWDKGDHNYEPATDNKGHEGEGPDGGPLFKVDSAKPWNRLPTGDVRPDTPLPTGATLPLYTKETVNINLLSESGLLMPGRIAIGKGSKSK